MVCGFGLGCFAVVEWLFSCVWLVVLLVVDLLVCLVFGCVLLLLGFWIWVDLGFASCVWLGVCCLFALVVGVNCLAG